MESILSQLRLLASPSANTSNLNERLQITLKEVFSLGPGTEIADTTKDIYKQYVQTCIYYLLELRSYLITHPDDPSAVQQRLSIQAQAIIRTVLEIVVCWGIKGVGVPIAMRSKTAAGLMNDEKQKDYRGDKRQLLECVRVFLLLQKVEDLAPIVLSRNLPDMFAALIQLLHEPMEDGDDELTSIDKHFCESSLMNLIKGVNPSLVVEGLSMGLGRGEAWYTKAVGSYMSRALMCPHGLRVILERVLGSEKARGSPAAFNHVVKLVISCPSTVSHEEYYSKICPQLLQLIRRSNKNPEYMRQASVAIIGKMQELQPELANKYFFESLLAPLRVMSDTTKNYTASESGDLSEDVVVDESTMAVCIEDIHTITNGLSLSQGIMKEIAIIIPTLFRLHLFITKTMSYLKTAVQEILVSFFRFSNTAVALLKELILPKEEKAEGAGSHPMLSFGTGGSGGIVVRITDTPNRNFSEEAMVLVSLLKEMKHDQLAGDLFVDLLSEFLSAAPDTENYIFSDDSDEQPKHTRYFVLLEVVAIIGEQMGASVLKNVVQVCTLLKILLTHEDPETISLALGLVLALLSGAIKVSKEEETLIYDLVPQLEQLINLPDNQISEMAAHVKTLILTNDSVWKDTQSGSEESVPTLKLNEDIKKIMEDVRDPLLPVRAHGLISLRKLVLRKEPEVQKYVPKILDIFWSQINDEDSYVFQTAINGLAALAKLAKQFSNAQLRLDTRLKLGEALLQIAARCGEVLPKYGSHFIHTFLLSLKDDDPNMRASSLSQLASFCEIMRFALHPYIREILVATNAIIASDIDAMVRRGGMHVFKNLLTSMGTELFSLAPDAMKDIYRRLRTVETYDQDELCKYNARALLAHIKDIIQDQVTPASASDVNSLLGPLMIQELN